MIAPNSALFKMEASYMAAIGGRLPAPEAPQTPAPPPEGPPPAPGDEPPPAPPVDGPVQETWANGVKHFHAGVYDRYELPVTTRGVPARIEVETRLGDARPPLVVGTDAAGERLPSKVDGQAGSPVLLTTDPRTGWETRLDPVARTIDIQTPTTKEGRVSTTAAREVVDADGNVFYFAHNRDEKARCFGSASQQAEVAVFPSDPRVQPFSEQLQVEQAGGFLCCGGGSVQDTYPMQLTQPDPHGFFAVMDPATGANHPHQLFVNPKIAG